MIVGLALLAALLALAALALRLPAVGALVAALPIGPGVGPTPPPPAIAAPAGPLPGGLAGVGELAQFGADSYRAVGCGFVLQLPDDAVIGVTTAHSVAGLGQPGNDLRHIAFADPQRHSVGVGPVVDFDTLYGQPGVPFSGDDLSVDLVLLRLPGAAEAARALAQAPDPRGAPQPGERVALYSGLGDLDGRASVLRGTVLSSAPTAAWLLMDDNTDPGGMSGSPVFSAYTGRVVGMAVAATHQAGRVLIGLNPIGAIVAHALAASTFPAIAAFTR
jgi:hypothetical protein